MIRLAITSDLHRDARTAGVARAADHDRFIDWLIEQLSAEACDGLLVLGDYYDPGRIDDLEHAAAYVEICHQVSRVCQSIWITGNHDAVLGSAGVTTMSPAASAFSGSDRVQIVERPAATQITGQSVVCLPYPIDPLAESYGEEVRRALGSAGNSPLVIAHLAIPGARMGSESEEMSRGPDIDFPVKLVADTYPLACFNGHYHRAQVVDLGKLSIHVPGAPLRLDFGERDHDPGILIAEVSDGRCDVRRLSYPHGQRLVQIRDRADIDGSDLTGALVKVSLPAEQSGLRQEFTRTLKSAGAAAVKWAPAPKPRETRAQKRERGPEVSPAEQIRERLSEIVTGATKRRAFEMLGELDV